jgi:hypothetical protein
MRIQMGDGECCFARPDPEAVAGALAPDAVGLATSCMTPAASAAAAIAEANARNLALCAATGLACIGGASKGLDAALKPADALIRRIEQTRAIRPVETLRRNSGSLPK